MSNTVTSCKNCCFAIYKGITQTGCSQNRFLYLEPINAYDEEKEFCLVPGQCMFHRSQAWGQDAANDNLDALDSTPFPYHAVVMGKNDTGKILATIQSIMNQYIPPTKITVIRPYGTTSDIKTIRLLLGDLGIKWRIENLLTDEFPYHKNRGMQELALTSNKIPYILFIEAGSVIPSSMIKDIKYHIYVQMLQFAAITYDITTDVMFMATSIWTYYRLATNIGFEILDAIILNNILSGEPSCKDIYRILPSNLPMSQKSLSYTPEMT